MKYEVRGVLSTRKKILTLLAAGAVSGAAMGMPNGWILIQLALAYLFSRLAEPAMRDAILVPATG